MKTISVLFFGPPVCQALKGVRALLTCCGSHDANAMNNVDHVFLQ